MLLCWGRWLAGAGDLEAIGRHRRRALRAVAGRFPGPAPLITFCRGTQTLAFPVGWGGPHLPDDEARRGWHKAVPQGDWPLSLCPGNQEAASKETRSVKKDQRRWGEGSGLLAAGLPSRDDEGGTSWQPAGPPGPSRLVPGVAATKPVVLCCEGSRRPAGVRGTLVESAAG
jgi:hypothetical protein